MKFDRFDKGGLITPVGMLVFFVASMSHDLVDPTQIWWDVTFWVMMFGAAVFYVGVGLLYCAPEFPGN